MASEDRIHRADEARDRKKVSTADLMRHCEPVRSFGAVAILLAALSPLAAPISSGQYAEVSGKVKDWQGSVIVGAIVEFVGENNLFTATTAVDGAYSVDLEPGAYTVTARKAHFCDGRRAAFSIESNQKAEFDFILPWRMEASDGLEVQDPHCYKEDEPNLIDRGKLRPFVLYGAREQKGNEVFYSSLRRHYFQHSHGTYVDENYPVAFSYDLLTLRADSLVLDSLTESITAIGDVILQNGTKNWHAAKVKVEFAKGEPVVTVIQ